MRDNIAMLVAALAQGAGEDARDAGGTAADVAVSIMRAARASFLGPQEDEAFAGSVGALIAVLPDDRDRIMAEARTLGDQGRLMSALLSGVPVCLERVTVAPLPDDAIGLLECWDRAAPAPSWVPDSPPLVSWKPNGASA